MYAGIKSYLSVFLGGVLDLVSEAGIEVVNKTGGALTKGTLVYVSGFDTGYDRPSVAKADHADPLKSPEYVLVEAIASNGKGVASPKALIGGLTTTGGTAGYPAFLSTTAGGFSISRTGTDLPRVGQIRTVHATNGYVLFDLTDKKSKRASKRIELNWTAGQRGKPALNAVIATDENSNAAAHLARNIADREFEVLGTNMTTALVTYVAGGGLAFTTAGADNDQAILLPHLDTNQTGWTTYTWTPAEEVHWAAHVKTGAAITTSIFWLGLKITNTSTTGTDNDEVFFRYQNGVNSGKWQALYSIANVDTVTDTGVTAALSTESLFEIKIDSSRIARFYIDGILVATSTALTSGALLVPYIGVQASGAAAARAVTVFSQHISKKAA